ncbi:anaerobic sulfatase maturase [Serratia rubidaea]|uniref:anaerobic sulfatase maturase n=1 Tax=Serratia rubidaea TaxID=61652 RepID=UPI00242CCB9F|nr:anaerobic sulfatase maturase [Serratia rubidaea]MCR0997151.1 anaerobic sulfatase maturase [Serratia rubidaea]
MNIDALRARQIPLSDPARAAAPFHLLVKPVGAGCNLACRYCYYPQRGERPRPMDDALLEAFIRRYIAAQPRYSREINFVWQGGEPLLAGIGFYKRALALQRRYAPPGVTISNSLQTNGTLLTDAWCRLFSEHDFIIGVSLDGDRQTQDAHRPDRRGNGSYDAALRGITLLQQHRVAFNLLVVVHDGVADGAAALYDQLTALGARFLQFQPLMLEGDAPAGGYRLSAANWGRFMRDIYRRWRQRGDVGRVFVMNIEHVYAQYFTQVSPDCVHAARCGGNLVMEQDGGVYACDHLIDDAHRLGRFNAGDELAVLADAARALPFGRRKSVRRECQHCSVKMVCQGGCPAHLGRDGYNRLCAGYYAFFSEVLAPLRRYSRDADGLALWRSAQPASSHP